MTRGIRGMLCAALVFASASCFAQTGEFEPVGIGGGGGMYTPLGSPADPDFWVMSCDMSGAYRTVDGGKTFQMLNWSQMRSCNGIRPCFAGNDVYWALGGRELKVSNDKAKTWQTVAATGPWGTDGIARIAALETTPHTLFVGNANALFVSGDAGKTWTKAAPAGGCTALAAVGADVYAALGGKLHKSADSGKTWTAISLPTQDAIRAVSGAVAKDKTSFVCVVVDKAGIAASADGGTTWAVAGGVQGANDVLVPAGQTKIAYASSGKNVWRTLDGGRSWQQCFQMGKNVKPSFVQTELHWGYGISPQGLGVSHADAKTVMVSTQGDFYVSHDAGGSWDQQMGTPAGRANTEGFRSKGLEVTTTWGYYIDPSDPKRHYIAYTDIGFCRSVDAGKTWISSVQGCPWSNTFYEIVFDPFVKGRMYAACSSRHDIPHWTHTDANKGQKGGVCVSSDYGRSWQVLGTGLPQLPCRGICIDPKSTPNKLVLYTTLYEGGVYKSEDGGRTWVKKSSGLGNPGNLHALQVRVHPKTGSVFCSITAMREGQRDFRIPGGIWKSTDGGDSWTDITKELKLVWPTGFALDPTDENVIYLTAATAPGASQGGLYKTVDGGKTWTRPLKDADFSVSFVHGMFVTLHPDDPKKVYVGSSAGLRYSPDAGTTWQDFKKIPFRNATIPAFDPKDPKTMWVTTFGGGVWKGNYVPVP